MSRPRLMLLTLWLAPLTLFAVEPPPDGQDNFTKLESIKRNPPQLAELRKQARVFESLTPAAKQRLHALHQALLKVSPARRDHLLEVGERYLDWLDKLPEKDRQAIQSAGDLQARLALVRQIREQEWIRSQPRSTRDRLAKLGGKEKDDLIKKVRAEERERQRQWKLAYRFWPDLNKDNFQPPANLSDLPPNIQEYVREYLLPFLSANEKKKLALAEGHWPNYPQTLVELADRHPPALPSAAGPATFADLPREVQKRLRLKGFELKQIKRVDNQWPEFARTVSLIAYKNYVTLPHDLWPAGFKVLSPALKDYVEKSLKPALDSDEKLRLVHADGKWPDYPLALQELGDKYHLPVPWPNLPSHKDVRWKAYRGLR